MLNFLIWSGYEEWGSPGPEFFSFILNYKASIMNNLRNLKTNGSLFDPSCDYEYIRNQSYK